MLDLEYIEDLVRNTKDTGERFSTITNKKADSYTMLLIPFFRTLGKELYKEVDFQRDYVWSLEQKQQLIMSMLNRVPIGNIYINKYVENEELCDVIYDGKQRLNAIEEFLSGKYFITLEEKEYFVTTLPSFYLNRILTYNLVISETNIEDKKELIEFYLLINLGGVRHSDEDILKAVELLNLVK